MTPTRSRRRRRQRRHVAIIAAVLVVFMAALVLWTRGLSGSAPVVLPSLAIAGATPVPEGPGSASVTPAGGTGTNGAGGTGAAGGDRLGTLPPDSLHTFAAGPHRVTITATGDLGTVAYIFRGQSTETKLHNVRGPFRMSRLISGTTNLAAIGIQVSYSGTAGSCSVIVDGTTIVHYTVDGPYRVVGCIV